MLLVATQVLWLQFDTWARDPQVRPLYAMVCGVVGCELPVMRDVESLRFRFRLGAGAVEDQRAVIRRTTATGSPERSVIAI